MKNYNKQPKPWSFKFPLTLRKEYTSTITTQRNNIVVVFPILMNDKTLATNQNPFYFKTLRINRTLSCFGVDANIVMIIVILGANGPFLQ